MRRYAGTRVAAPAGGAIELKYSFRKSTARTNAPGTCLWCGTKLRRYRWEDIHPGALGDYADNAFCGLRCGYCFGVWAAVLGFRLQPKPAAVEGQ